MILSDIIACKRKLQIMEVHTWISYILSFVVMQGVAEQFVERMSDDKGGGGEG